MYKYLLKSLLFLLSPEKAHHFTLSLAGFFLAIPGMRRIAKTIFGYSRPGLHRDFMGLHFQNPIGLAAGFDKDGKHYKKMAALGFGFIEIGTVTPKPQIGNPKPRLFRLPDDEALINRMGFNNEGVDAMVGRLKNRNTGKLIIGGNIGKNKMTPNEKAVEDYLICFEKLFSYVDYFVVNVSSPNTPNLRALQEKGPLSEILNALQKVNHSKPSPKPILLKIAPDLTKGQLDDILEIVEETKIQGVIATNTTISREGLETSNEAVNNIGAGGLSGKPLGIRSTEVIQYLSQKSNGNLFIIGVGGIRGPEDALEKLAAGASLLQVYSGLIYEGPAMIKRLNKTILAKSTG
ncbi:MAG: quinone-dependent dihydroorotate dehydrogenase [Saprospiraceae bacterium]|nr:quinone-dependent dihydroorotate dehydrogenase [Saprospiraceae bacterium]